MGRREGWTTRLGTRADVPAITAMYRRNGFDAAQGDPALAWFYFTALRAAGGEALVAVEGGEVVGHLELLLCDETPPLGRYGHVETLEVREDRRRLGIGRALLVHAVELTRAAGGTRLEVWTGDDNAPARALYAAAGFTPGPRLRDLELTVPAADLEGAAPLGPPLDVGHRPWETMRHVAGRQYPAAYCWWRAHLASGWALPYGAAGARRGAWRLADPPGVVMADPWLVHLFLPAAVAPEAVAARPAWLAMLALAGAGLQRTVRTVRTVVPAALDAQLGLSERWLHRVIEEYTLLVQDVM
ncbi:MAG TPA: GNAT family N-acetyltransferase [Chloroflexota bacterium]|nr:GNAT family N-acetyltransferase [Chloroflexota bacterium]